MKNTNEAKNTRRHNDDYFTKLMFPVSKQTERKKTANQLKDQQNHPLFSMIEQMNYEELMQNIDVLLESTKGFKPLFQRIPPLVEKFLKQKS